MAKSRKKKRSTRSKKTVKRSNQVKVFGAAVFLVAFIGASLAVLNWLRLQHESAPQTAEQNVPYTPPIQVPTVPAPTAPQPPEPKAPVTFPAQKVAEALRRCLPPTGAGVDLSTVQKGDAVSSVPLNSLFPSPSDIQRCRQRLQALNHRIGLISRPQKHQLLISWNDEARYRLVFVAPPIKEPAKGPRVAIIMDDLGQYVGTARALVGMDLKVTGAIIPSTPHARQTAQILHQNGRQVMVHIPMQPQAYPRINPGPKALLLGQSPQEMERRLSWLFAQVPYAEGGNNHMGSRLTEERAPMALVMRALKERDWFFVDSVTSARSVGLAQARRYGVPSVGRDVFLDNVRSVEKIGLQLHQLARKAKQQGQAVGICHPYPETLKALKDSIPMFRRNGIEVVYVSDLVH